MQRYARGSRAERFPLLHCFPLAFLSALACTTPSREIPFELASNKPWVQVEIDGSGPSWFILDSGCAGASVVARKCADRIGLALEGSRTESDIGAGEGVALEVASARDVALAVAGVSMRAPEIGVFPLDHVEPYEGRAVDGLLGGDFLRSHVVEIDYARRRIRIHEPEAFRYAGGAEPIPISFRDGLAVVRAVMTPPGREPIPCRVVVDTGVRTTVIWYRPFVLANDLLASQPRVVTGTIGGGASGETKGDVGRLESLEIGSLRIPEPTTVFSRDAAGVFAGSQEDGIVGGEILRRCKVTFDYPRGRLYLEPYTDAFRRFEGDGSGMFLVSPGPDFDRVRIQSVAEGTPSAEAGLRPGDEIVAIDGRPVAGRPLDEVRELFRKEETSYRLDVRRGGEDRAVTLKLRRLV